MHQDGEDPVYKELPLDEDRKVRLSPEDYEWASAWTWAFDEDSGEAVRYDQDGNKVFLYHELVRKHVDTDELIILHGDSIWTIFGRKRAFGTFLKQWDARQHITDIELPDPFYLAGCCLTLALNMFFTWEKGGRSIKFKPDKENLTPGWLLDKKAGSYKTLGAWMRKEHTGEWLTFKIAPCGLIPESFEARILAGIILIAKSLMVAEGWEEDEVDALWEEFSEAEMSLEEPLIYLLTAFTGYKVI
jgi:hypothetical protein